MKWLAVLVLLAGVGIKPVYAQEPYRELVCGFDWNCGKALRVLQCESRGDPSAYTGGNFGLFQIRYASHATRIGPDANVLFDPETNIRIAHEIWAESGWGAWGCRGA